MPAALISSSTERSSMSVEISGRSRPLRLALPDCYPMLRLRQRRPKDNPYLILSFVPFIVHPVPFNADCVHSMFGASCPANFIAMSGRSRPLRLALPDCYPMLRLRQRRPKDNPNLILSFLPFTVDRKSVV